MKAHSLDRLACVSKSDGVDSIQSEVTEALHDKWKYRSRARCSKGQKGLGMVVAVIGAIEDGWAVQNVTSHSSGCGDTVLWAPVWGRAVVIKDCL